ncbi:MAG: 23S rRNA (adenine(2503)-C(2))-methyltransferase RlmN [Chloroflexi bacterium]|nr:23S rRNA (adenine(2503)-C(2))-methyltransferase RlmN [Chloroflexota bacterium]
MLDVIVQLGGDARPPVLKDVLQAAGEPPFRLRQVLDWKYHKLASGYGDMRNIPLALRERLAREAPFARLRPVDEAWSTDRQTTKLLFALPDEQTIESVLMRQHGAHEAAPRNTVCVSSQAGCKMACSFCATGHGGWRRNLEPDEIADQVLHFARLLKDEDAHVTNVVFMGMGEPLDNYENVLAAIGLLNGPFGLGTRNITVSTCGLVPQIRRLAEEPIQANLAVSLAATTDERRNGLIPVNRRWPIHELLEACDAYARRTHRRVTFEYVLIAGVNDGADEAERLASLMAGRLAHVNLIPLNPVEGDGYRRPSENAIRRFEDVLRAQHIPVSVRYSKGTDIVAGCGQLRARSLLA